MFFNEDVNELLESSAEPMTQDEMQEAIDASGGLGAVSEDFNFYSESLEWLEGANEYWYNLREKMMNIEHVASIKETQGLYSESAAIMNEGFGGFVDKVKSFFEKVKNFIVKLFQKFVNFVSSLFVSTKDVLNINASEAWNHSRMGGKKFKVKVLNIEPKVMLQAPQLATKALNSIEAENAAIRATVGKMIINVKDNDGNMLSVNKNKKEQVIALRDQIDKEIPKKLATRFAVSKDALHSAIFTNIFQQGNKEVGDSENTVLQRKEKEITESEFVDRMKYAKSYTSIIAQVRQTKDAAMKLIDNCIKDVKKQVGKTGSDSVNSKDKTKRITEYDNLLIKAYKNSTNLTSKLFSKLTSVCSQYYRECIAIGKRVIGGNNAKDKVKDLKKMTEGFDFEAYFDSI